MAQKRGNRSLQRKKPAPQSLKFAQRGITTAKDFAGMMSALISDILGQNIDPRTANAVCNAGGKLLKVVELQHRYGRPSGNPSEQNVLQLV